MTIRKHYIATTDSGLVGARTPERRSTVAEVKAWRNETGSKEAVSISIEEVAR